MHPWARACRKPSGGRAFPSPFVAKNIFRGGRSGERTPARLFARPARLGRRARLRGGFHAERRRASRAAPRGGASRGAFSPGPLPRRYYERFDWSFACSTHASECTDCWRVGGRDGGSSAVNTTARPPAVSPSRPRRRRRRAFYWKRRHGPSSNSSLERWGAGERVRALTKLHLSFFFFPSLQAGGRQRWAVAAAQARATARGVVAGVFAVARARGAVGAFAAAAAAAAAAGAGG